jgi:hypothetical protein
MIKQVCATTVLIIVTASTILGQNPHRGAGWSGHRQPGGGGDEAVYGPDDVREQPRRRQVSNDGHVRQAGTALAVYRDARV